MLWITRAEFCRGNIEPRPSLSCSAKAGHLVFQRPLGSSTAASGILDRPVKPGDDTE
jgi:hypothetical protein